MPPFTFLDYKGLQVGDVTPSGVGGAAIDGNMRELADRVGPVANLAGAPTVNSDSANTDTNGAFQQFSKWRDTDTDAIYMCADPTPTAAVWFLISGGGGSVDYVVDVNGTGTHLTVQAAVDDAETRGIEATIQILAGKYTENVNIVQGGIALHGFGSWGQGLTEIIGNVTFTPTVTGAQISLREVYITGTLELAGAVQCVPFVENVQISQSGGASPLLLSNTNSGSVLVATRMTCEETSDSAPALSRPAGGGMSLDCYDCEFSRGGGSNAAIDFADGAGSVVIRNPIIVGSVDISGTSVGLQIIGSAGRWATTSAATPLIVTAGNGFQLLRGVFVEVAGGSNIPIVSPATGAVLVYAGVKTSNCSINESMAVSQFAVDGVTLKAAGLATEFLNAAGLYAVPPAAGSNGQIQINSGGAQVGASGITTLDGQTLGIAGDLGVGIAAPDERLHIFKDVNGNARLKIENPNTGAQAQVSLDLFQGSSRFVYFVLQGDDAFKIFSTTGGKIISTNDSTGSMSINSPNLADASAVLDLVSVAKGFLQPRMTTTQRDAIASPAAGLSIYNTTILNPQVFNGTTWESIGGNVVGPAVATDDALARFDTTTGKLLQNSSATLTDGGRLTANRFNATEDLNVVHVYTSSDLPSTLVAGNLYLLHAPITRGDGEELTFPSGSVAIETTNVQTNTLEYSGGSTFLNGTVATQVILSVQINSTGSGTLFDLTADGSLGSFMVWNSGGCQGWNDLGTLTSFNSVIHNFLIFVDFDSGLSLVSCPTYATLNCLWFNFSDSSTTFLDFDSNIEEINVGSVGFSPFPNERVFNIDSGATPNVFLSAIQRVASADLYFEAGSLDQTDPGVVAKNCSNLPDSAISAEVTLLGNTATTSIPAVGAMVEFGLDVSWIASQVERLTVDTDGAVTLNALRPARIKIDANINLEPANATKSLSVRMVLLTPTTQEVTFTNSTNLINETATTLSDGDVISFRDTAGTLPAEIRDDIVYFVVSKLANSFQVAYTSGGSAIAFTDDGTPTNSYRVASLHGSTPTNSISSSSPRDLIPQGLVPSVTGGTSFLVVINNTDAVDVEVNSGYQRNFE